MKPIVGGKENEIRKYTVSRSRKPILGFCKDFILKGGAETLPLDLVPLKSWECQRCLSTAVVGGGVYLCWAGETRVVAKTCLEIQKGM